jgi:hypothetical protein
LSASLNIPIFSAGTSGTNDTNITFNSDIIDWFNRNGGSINGRLNTTQVFRDPSAWYHLVFVWDTTNGTSSNRMKIYVNGSLVTALSTATYPGPSQSSNINNNVANYIGLQTGTSNYFDGYLTEINFIDGQALTPSSFGSTNAITGVWQPAKYTGTYGTNGFYLNFSDNSNNTATTIGKDYSGNGNNWTPNNISVTAGVTYDSMTDVPTLTSTTAANWCTWNPLLKGSDVSTASGNLEASWSGANGHCIMATMTLPQTGKWKCEITGVYQVNFGITPIATQKVTEGIGTTVGYGYRGTDGQKVINGSYSAYGATYGTSDVITLLYNADTLVLEFKKNNTSQGTISVASDTYVVGVGYQSPSAGTAKINFGQQPFTYTDSGFVALNTYNLPASTITNGAAYMAATTFTGVTGGGSVVNTVNGVGFQPDFVWMKCRSVSRNHELDDSVRGTPYALFSNVTNAEVSDTRVSAFNSNGFSYGTNSNSAVTGDTEVGWQWKAGGTSASNTNGTITSTVSVGATQGFSVVTFTAPASGNFSAGHGLGVTPGMVITKVRGRATNWITWHNQLNSGSPGTTYYIDLNLTGGQSTFANVWGSTGVTSSVIGMGVNASCAANDTIVAYCFSAVAGYSAIGSYTGNSSTDGTFVYTGFRPRWVLIKGIGSGGSGWQMNDSSRNTYNPEDAVLRADLPNQETTAYGTVMDFLSNGFKLRVTDTNYNSSSTTYGPYIYIAFAENPFKNALAR